MIATEVSVEYHALFLDWGRGGAGSTYIAMKRRMRAQPLGKFLHGPAAALKAWRAAHNLGVEVRVQRLAALERSNPWPARKVAVAAARARVHGARSRRFLQFKKFGQSSTSGGSLSLGSFKAFSLGGGLGGGLVLLQPRLPLVLGFFCTAKCTTA